MTGWKTQKQMCQALRREASESTVSEWVKKRKPINDEWLRQIANAFGVHFEWLKTGEGPKEHREYIDQLPGSLREVVELALQHPTIHEPLARCARVLASDHPDAPQVLARLAANFDEWVTTDAKRVEDLRRRDAEPPPSVNGVVG